MGWKEGDRSDGATGVLNRTQVKFKFRQEPSPPGNPTLWLLKKKFLT